MAWMRSYDDSKEEVKKNILEVIETNDIDGLTLKQLRADSEEIHTLFPSLKERLTFKAMLRDLFKVSFSRFKHIIMHFSVHVMTFVYCTSSRSSA